MPLVTFSPRGCSRNRSRVLRARATDKPRNPRIQRERERERETDRNLERNKGGAQPLDPSSIHPLSRERGEKKSEGAKGRVQQE